MTCATCGAVGAAGATWCPRCSPPPAPPFVPQHYSPPPMPFVPHYPPPSPQQYPPAYQAMAWPAELGLVLPESAVAVGDLPRVCVVSGQPTDQMQKMRWIWAPRWITLAIYFGALFFFVLRAMLGDKASGYLPLHPSVSRRFKRLQAGGYSLVAVGFVLLCVSAAVLSGLLALLGLAVSAGGFLLAEQPHRLLPVKRAGQGYLALPKASPEFAAAFNAGRPPGQVPYAVRPPVIKGVRKAFWVPGAALIGLCILAAIVAPLFLPS